VTKSLPGYIVIEVQDNYPNLKQLKKECGGHRIQRVPPTERKGRVHTSTVTVAFVDDTVYNESIKDEDLHVEWYSGSGAGGQHRNKHQNSCRLTHVPSGIVTRCSTRSRKSSYDGAKVDLERRLSSSATVSQNALSNNIRQRQVGSGMRGDKIRTYRFQDDTVTDHNSGKTENVRKIMKGNFHLLW